MFCILLVMFDVNFCAMLLQFLKLSCCVSVPIREFLCFTQFYFNKKVSIKHNIARFIQRRQISFPDFLYFLGGGMRR